MLYTKFQGNQTLGFEGAYLIWAWKPSWSCDTFSSQHPMQAPYEKASCGLLCFEEKQFENVESK